MKKDVLIILPAFNEGKVISSVISNIKKEGFENILVVDDCSCDDTYDVSLNAGAMVVRHPINRGAGAASATGVEFARRDGFENIVLMDSDGQHSQKDIKRLLSGLDDGFDVVIGSRLLGDISDMPIQRKIANKIGSIVTLFFFGKYVTDSQSGFKAFNRKAIENIDITFDTYEFCSEIIGEIHLKNLKLKEIPIKVVYTEHSMNKGHGQSVFNGFKMIVKFLMRG